MTYDEYTHLSPLVLVSRLSKQGRFLEALKLCVDLNLGKSLQNAILTDWTKEQLNKNADMEDDEIQKILIGTLKEYDVSYTSIAKVIYLDRPDVAYNIIQYEKDPTKKILSLLGMERYDEALDYACKTFDTELVFLVIKKLEGMYIFII